MRLLYFAQLADTLGQTEEQISPPADVNDIESLLDWLRRRGGAWEDLTTARLRVTVDRQFASTDSPINDANEFALIPRR